jgi:hypothetical protein
VAPWTAILVGDAQQRALDAARAIASALIDPPPPKGPAASLGGGLAGQALLYAYLARAFPDAGYQEQALARLEAAIDAAGELDHPALYGGLTGVAFVAEHLRGWLLDDTSDPNDQIDEPLLEAVSASPWNGHYDLVSGLVGIGVYALERRRQAAGVATLERVVERLQEMSEPAAGGTTWRTPQGHTGAGLAPGAYNLGLAHGVPGVIALLALACQAGIATTRARPLLEGALRWLWSVRLESGDASFGYHSAASEPARSGWCYGDPGVGAALRLAGMALQSAGLSERALALARAVGARSPERTAVVDAGLCHGAVALGHILNRFYQASGDPVLAQQAGFWYQQALAMRRPGEGIAGYLSWNEQSRWEVSPGLLNGAAGIALALLAAATPVEPVWDRVLLLS